MNCQRCDAPNDTPANEWWACSVCGQEHEPQIPQECKTEIWSSRVCERGTKCCVVQHKKQFRAREFYPGRWHIIAPDGMKVYDDERDGKDKPIVFTDEDRALECVDRFNAELEKGEEE